MRFITALVLVLLLCPAMSAHADPVFTLQTDGNNHLPLQAWCSDSEDWVILQGDSTGAFKAYVAGGSVNIPAYTLTSIAYDTELTGTTFDTFTLSEANNLIYVGGDTDILVSLTYAEAAAGYGEVQYAGITTPYPYRTQYVWIRTKSGLALSGGHVSVRGMR